MTTTGASPQPFTNSPQRVTATRISSITKGLTMTTEIDQALLAAIQSASATSTSKPKAYGRQLVAIAFGDDDEPVRAGADKLPLVKFCDYLNTRRAA